jgi:protein-S-isoprenylcysteine O-methyltransferase Ste14
MIYGYARHATSAQRYFVVIAQTVIAAAALWLLLGGGISAVGRLLGAHLSAGSAPRRLLLALLVVLTYARFTLMITVFLLGGIGWEEAISVQFGFLLYYIAYSFLGGTRPQGLGWLDLLAILLFLAGSTANTVAELLRNRFKRDPANAGKLYSGGLFRYSRHINYFGDVVWVSGWAVLSHNVWSIVIPVMLFCMFAFYNVPLLDKHLAERYGEALEAYRSRTKGLVPFLW